MGAVVTALSPTPGYDEWQLSQRVEAIKLHAEHKPEALDWDTVREAAEELDALLRAQGVRR